MERKAWILPFCLLLCLCLTPVRAAALDGNPYASAYEWDNAFYVAFRTPGINADRVQLKTEGRIQYDITPERTEDSDLPVCLTLLIDYSNSMPEYKDRLFAVAEALTASLRNYDITVMRFGREFQVVQPTHLRDWKSVKKTLDALKLTDTATDICGGAVHAIEALKEELWTPGNIAHVVLITDGEPYYSGDPVKEAEQEIYAAELLENELARSPQILLHSVCLNAWRGTERTYQAVSSCGGVHQTVSGIQEAEAAGREIASFVNELYIAQFPLAAEYYSKNLTLLVFSNISSVPELAIPITRSANLDVEADETVNPSDFPEISGSEHGPLPLPQPPEEREELPELILPSPLPSESGAEEAEAGVGDASSSSENEQGSVQLPLPDVQSEHETTDGTDHTGNLESDAAPSEANMAEESLEQEKSGFPLFAIVTAALLLLLIGGAVWYVLWRRGRSGILLYVTLKNGIAEEDVKNLYLRDHLLIGSDSRCDLILRDSSVAPMNTRIFRKDHDIYIEDLNSPYGTAIDSMRIFTPTLLYDKGDVRVGNVDLYLQIGK